MSSAGRFVSTRGEAGSVDIAGALAAGLAPDGGLYIPEAFPRFDAADFADASEPCETAEVLLAPFFAGSDLESEVGAIAREALNFPIPVVETPKHGLSILELFHGPTAAFKDVGARFLASCLSRVEGSASDLNILVATSGDTGGAVAAAFEGRPVGVSVLYPAGMVSPRQEHQLTCWADPIRSYRVDGTFDDCQRMVKEAFVDADLGAARRLTSANSISVGRLLPQTVYYAHAALMHHRKTGEASHFIVPTGNLGNALACIWARQMGLPIGAVVLATNANKAVPHYLDTGRWEPQATVNTLASAMDVGNPSNMERLRNLFPDLADLTRDVHAYAINDAQIEDTIAWAWSQLEAAVCPHTATAIQAWRWLRREGDQRSWTAVATAHPAKFEQIVESIIGQEVPVPKALSRLLERPQSVTSLPARTEALKQALLSQG